MHGTNEWTNKRTWNTSTATFFHFLWVANSQISRHIWSNPNKRILFMSITFQLSATQIYRRTIIIIHSQCLLLEMKHSYRVVVTEPSTLWTHTLYFTLLWIQKQMHITCRQTEAMNCFCKEKKSGCYGSLAACGTFSLHIAYAVEQLSVAVPCLCCISVASHNQHCIFINSWPSGIVCRCTPAANPALDHCEYIVTILKICI